MKDEKIVQLIQKFEQLKTENESVNATINQHKCDIQHLYSQSGWSTKVGEQSEEIIRLKSEVNELKSSVEKLKLSMNSEMILKSTLITDITKEIKNIVVNIGSLDKELLNIHNLLVIKESEIYETIKRKLLISSYNNEKTFEELKSCIVASPKSILTTNEEIIEKLEQVQLDYKNAIKKINFLDFCIRKNEKELNNKGL